MLQDKYYERREYPSNSMTSNMSSMLPRYSKSGLLHFPDSHDELHDPSCQLGQPGPVGTASLLDYPVERTTKSGLLGEMPSPHGSINR